MNKIKILLIAVVTIIAGYFVLSTIAYQWLINEGSVLADNECLIVNPLIIERKNSYLASMQILQDAESIEDYKKETNNYLAVAQKYVDAQEMWLKDQRAHMDRWEFRFFIPFQLKIAAQAQYTSREAEVELTKAIIEQFGTNDIGRQKELSQIISEQTNKRNEADDEYNRIWDSPRKFDFRTRFIKVPESKCPPENFDIPYIPDFLDPETAPTKL